MSQAEKARSNIHRMPDQDALIQVLLLDELLYILGHDTVVVLFRVKRMTMVPEILGHCQSALCSHVF